MLSKLNFRVRRFEIPNDHKINYSSVSENNFKARDPTLISPLWSFIVKLDVESGGLKSTSKFDQNFFKISIFLEVTEPNIAKIVTISEIRKAD